MRTLFSLVHGVLRLTFPGLISRSFECGQSSKELASSPESDANAAISTLPIHSFGVAARSWLDNDCKAREATKMSAGVRSMINSTDSLCRRADQGEVSLHFNVPSERGHCEIGPFRMSSDNEPLRAELRREKERLKLLLALAGQAISNQELHDLIRAIMVSIRSAIPSDGVCVFLADKDELEVYELDFRSETGNLKEGIRVALAGAITNCVFRTGKPWVGSFREGTRVALAGTIASHVLRTGSPWADSREEAGDLFPQQILLSAAFKYGCVVPLSGGKGAIGTLGLVRADANPYCQEELDFLVQVSPQITLALQNALAFREISELKDRLAQEKLYLEDEIHSEMNFGSIIGNSSALKQTLKLVGTVAPSDSTVLLLGETGTGKELMARAIHDHSRRKERSFVKLNCAAIPTGLLESELFGHEKGAFTGAIMQKIGRLELADQGTLFLDEVGDISPEVQPKLLRALQEREFERLGSTHTRKVNVRLVAATNRDLDKMVAERQFRSDLYYRLNVFPIRIPPLRDRKEDIPQLVSYFVQKFSRQMQKNIEVIPVAVMKRLTAWEWPGNIRELENFIERAVILTHGKSLEAPLAELHKWNTNEPTQPAAQRPTEGLARIMQETINALNAGKENVADEFVRKQREQIVHALTESKGRVGGADGAASRMSIPRTTLINRMKKFGISARQYA